ncbi:2-aminobenzoate-CoA ligase [Nocardia tenerifensis]|uniref:2-aminobenzoate-CoA ligase n=1 Tax=Nocardia tenerifensis TaxID=228006 RepID=A0A318KHB0_9NOCA|nr:AMP-binding protein [Nocardia tenerifensis]PXX71563.1 2-aminobenzoate-CoA ligase [Nocardia tenerifensis]
MTTSEPSADLHLPPRDLWPHRVHGESRSYPATFNATEVLLDRHLDAGHGDRPALRYGDTVLSYERLARRVNRFGNALRELGVRPGDRVVLASLNEWQAFVTNFAVLKLGATIVPTSPLLTPEQLAVIVKDCTPKLVVASSYLIAMIDATRDLTSDAPRFVAFDATDRGQGRAAPGWESLEALAESAAEELAPTARPHDAVALLLYSSGLLEPAMATAHLQEELLLIPDRFGRHGWAVTPDDVIAGAGPISFAGGYSTNLTIPFRFGAAAAIFPLATTPAQMFPLIAAHGVTLLAALPTRYGEMLAVPGADPKALRSLRIVSGGGEPLDPRVAAGWRERFGLEIYEGFGTNGMAHVFLTTAVTKRVKPGSAGTPLPGYTTRLVTQDDRLAAVGEPGRLQVRGPIGTLHWGHPSNADEVTRRQRASVRDGWVHIGDWLTVDEEGDHHFVARAEDLIRRGGVAFGPMEIEQVLLEDPAVAEAGVYAAAGELVAAVVPTEDGVNDHTAARLAEHVRARCGPEKVPDTIDFVAGLPRSPFGTLLRRARWADWFDAAKERADR